MAWYEAHQTLAKHPKTLKLSSLLKCERRYAVGLLHDLFSWGLDAAQKDGSLPGLSAEEIAIALDYTGKKGLQVVAALQKSGYLENEDGTFKIHDWHDYAGKLADKREDDRRRKKEWKERGKNAEKMRKESGNPYVTVPNRTVPNNTTPTSNAHAREEEPEPEPENDLGRVMSFYMDKINPVPSMLCVDDLKGYTETLGADVVLHAMGVALNERKTAWSYIRAILQRYQRDGVKNMNDVLLAEQEFQARKDGAKNGNDRAAGKPENEARPEFNVHYAVE